MISPTKSETDTDSELVKRARLGCLDAFEELVRKYQFPLRQFLARQVGDLATADDIAQDVLMIAMKKMGDLKDDHAFSPWLLSIARNKSIDHFRKLARMRRTPNEKLDYLIAKQRQDETNFEDLEQQELLRNVLHKCIGKLSTQAQSLVQQFYFENETAVEIADRQGHKSSSVRMALLRVRKSLAQCITKNSVVKHD